MSIRRETIWQAIEYASMVAIVVCGLFLASGCVESTRGVTDTTNADQSVAAIRELTAQVNTALDQYHAGRDIAINDPVAILGIAVVIFAGMFFAGRPMIRVVVRLLELLRLKKNGCKKRKR